MTSYGRLVIALTLIASGLTFWRAWVCDDAYITFRVVRNVHLGYGPVFNVGERVQVFTHPLWLLILLAGGSFWSNLHGMAVLLGLVLSAFCFLVLGRALRPAVQVDRIAAPAADAALGKAGFLLLLGSCVLLASPSFVEFQTSGLETGLTHLLLILLYGQLLLRDPPRPALVFFLAGLLVMNRPDQALLVAPLLGCLALRAFLRDRRQMLQIMLTLFPAMVWYAFATIYYGTPFPNTAYAKAGGLGWRQGLLYAREYVVYEPSSALTIAAALLAGPVWSIDRMRQNRRWTGAWLCVSIGLWLQVAYVIRIGGDFMRGRFWLTSLVTATFILLTILRDLLPERGYQRPMHWLLLLAFPVTALVRIIDYLPIGPMTGFVSLRYQAPATLLTFLLGVLSWAIGAIFVARALRRRKSSCVLTILALLVNALLLLTMAGYREMHWTTGLAYALLLGCNLLLLWRQAAGSAYNVLLLSLAALSVVVVPHLIIKPIQATLGNGIVHEYDFYTGPWYGPRFHQPDAAGGPWMTKWIELGRDGRAYSERFGPIVLQYGALGNCGWEAGSKVHQLDIYGLADAFIARSPHLSSGWAGHIEHAVPLEYFRTLGDVTLLPDWTTRLHQMDPTLRRDALAMAQAAASQSWSDPGEQQRFEETRLMVAGSIFSWERLRRLGPFILPRWAQ